MNEYMKKQPRKYDAGLVAFDLAGIRKRAGLTQRELATATGYTSAAISLWERRGKVRPAVRAWIESRVTSTA